jgi:hypothetical protein
MTSDNDINDCTMNGHGNGLANGHLDEPAKGNVNGHANGHMNGHTNGYIKGTHSPAEGDANDLHSTVPTFKQTAFRLLKDVMSQLGRLPENADVFKSIVESHFTEDILDDRQQLLEKTIQAACSFDKDSPAASFLTHNMLDKLWTNLQHPPMSYMGDAWRYRMADGSHNNILYPDLGKAGSYYARSVVPTRAPSAALPDPGDVFDLLFAREGAAKEHPAKFSSVAISLATVIIHDIFRTDDADHNKVASSSYLDLGPLYGHNQAMQDKVRAFRDGKLKPDAFAEPRILGQPPGVGALLVAFNRFHNYIATQLAEINEGGRFSLATKGDPEKAQAKRDNDLFQTARLVTCGLYVNIILRDYVRVILNLNRADTTWSLDPRADDFNVFDADGIPKGVGNQVSVEFNLVYRWHATVSNHNEEWMRGFMQQLWPGQDPASITQEQLVEGMRRWGHALDQDPGKWTFGGLARTESGAFDDAGLVDILSSTTEDLAGAFGARNVPTALRAIEILGINQGRNWGTASLNEFRRFFKLRPHKTFLDINPDPDVAASLEALYREPDNVELYPGLVCEETKELEVPGSGLCAGLTVAKAILSDAVSLVRGDRYYTVDSSPANLTSFGFNEIATNTDVAFGTAIYKLFQRAFPGWYRSNSVYALFPLTIPSENRAIMAAKGIEADYDYDRPRLQTPPAPVRSYDGVVAVLGNQPAYKVPWGKHVFELIQRDWMLSGDKPKDAEQKRVCMHALYSPDRGVDQIRDFYSKLTDNLIAAKSIKLRDRYQIDVVRDVAIPSHAIATANIWAIPLKERESDPGAGMTPARLHEAMEHVFRYGFLDIDAAKTLAIQKAAHGATAAMAAAVAQACAQVEGSTLSFLTSFVSQIYGSDANELPDYGKNMIQRLLDAGMSVDEVIWTVVPTAAATAPVQTLAITRLLDFYLSPENAAHWADIQAAAASDAPEDLEKLRKYALEGIRLSPALAGSMRVVAEPNLSIPDGDRTITPAMGSVVRPDFNTAGVDPKVFPDPHAVKLDRPDDLYIHFGYGAHACLGKKTVPVTMAVQLRAFARLKNLRRAPGPAGQLKATTVNGGLKIFMNEDWSEWTPFPSTWRLYYDA